VPIADTVGGVAAILDGAYDQVPLDALFMIGAISEVRNG
jgi:F0F1-type ATP synthase beta subunit